MDLFWIIIVLVVLGFVVESVLAFLNRKNLSNTIPKELIGIYEQEKYDKQQQYSKEKMKFSFISSCFSFALILAMLFFDGFAFVNNKLMLITENPIYLSLLFFGVLGFAADILNIPFNAYFVFNIEKRYGFNKTTLKTFVLDKIKSWVLVVVFGGGILSLIIYLFNVTGDWFWLLAWGVFIVFSVFVNLFYSNIIVPLFNKQTPLEDGDLKEQINEFAKKVGFDLKNIYVIDGSKRSTKANAYFTGLGRKKRIVLYDTLINNHTNNELVAVLAHEIGHYKLKHTIYNLLSSVMLTGILLYVFGRIAGNPLFSQALGVENPSFHISLLTFGLLYNPINVIIDLISNSLSRKNEFQADKFAADNYSAKELSNALIKLSINSLSNLQPHPLYVKFYYSHPTVVERIGKMEKKSEVGSRKSKVN